MHATESPDVGPPLSVLTGYFHVHEVRTEGERIEYYGVPLESYDRLLRELWPVFNDAGYRISFSRRGRTDVIVAEPIDTGMDGIPWTNVVLLLATIVSTLIAGALWFHIDPSEGVFAVLNAWPFTVALLTVLGIHELGHYVMSRYHGVDATLPYFIPIPSIIGTAGAVIKMSGPIPDRRAQFDIGVAGPLAGLVATVIVTAIGLTLDPMTVPAEIANSDNGITVMLGHPPLLELIATALGESLYADDPMRSVHPVVIGGWVGMFITFLNMIPVGQLDGGHISRAMFGRQMEAAAALVPWALFGLAGYLYYGADVSFGGSFIWVFWGLIALFFVAVGPAQPLSESSLGPKRMAIGMLAFLLAALCFTPVPFEVIG